MLWKLLLKHWKVSLATLLVILALGGGFWWGHSSVKPTVITKVEIQEKIVEKIVKVEVEKKKKKTNKVTKIVEKPDGTKETVITEKEELTEETNTKTKNDKIAEKKEKKDPKAVFSPQKRYRAGAYVDTEVMELFDRPEVGYGINAGLRAFGPFWLDAHYHFQNKSVGLGISMEF